jgi:hypothetical protein
MATSVFAGATLTYNKFLLKMRQRPVIGGSVDNLEGIRKETVVAEFKAVPPHSLGGKGIVVPVLNY